MYEAPSYAFVYLHGGLILTAWNSTKCVCSTSGASGYWRGSCPSVSERGEITCPYALGIFSTCHTHACVCASLLLFFCSAGSQRYPHELHDTTETGSCSEKHQARSHQRLRLLSDKYTVLICFHLTLALGGYLYI